MSDVFNGCKKRPEWVRLFYGFLTNLSDNCTIATIVEEKLDSIFYC